MKRCVTRGLTLAVSQFNRKRSAGDGLQNVCRDCNRSRARSQVEYLLSHPCVA